MVMAHIGRTVKNVEAPRPLKSQSRPSLKNNYMVMEELITLIENVTAALSTGVNNIEPMSALVQNLRIHGPNLESLSKNTLDRAFVVFRNASQDERLNIMTRLNLLELIELRAKGWEDNGTNSYYKTKQATSVELPEVQQHQQQQQHVDSSAFLSTSPTFGGLGGTAAIGGVGSAQQQQLLLGPGEVIRNSGKFSKPTKIPGKTYCKDEVVIRNADSGKVNPGAKERLVQITGPSEDKINYAKQLIEDTIRRNASPVRLEPATGTGAGVSAGGAGVSGGGSCSSLASSNSDEVTMRSSGAPPGTGSSSTLTNRLSFNSAQNFMTASAAAAIAAQQQQMQQQQMLIAAANAAAGKMMRPAAAAANQQLLLHSFSTNDASVGEYKYTVNVGAHVIKITGDCFDFVKAAKLVLDDFFNSENFLSAMEAGIAYDGSGISPIATPSTPLGAPQFGLGGQPLADSGVGLNFMAGQIASTTPDVEDEVFTDNNASNSQSNGLARSRRSHFSRKDSTPETITASKSIQKEAASGLVGEKSTRITYDYEDVLFYAKSPHSWAVPIEWAKICDKFPAIIRNKVIKSLTVDNSTSASTSSISNTTTTTTTITTTTVSKAVVTNNNNNSASATTNITSSIRNENRNEISANSDNLSDKEILKESFAAAANQLPPLDIAKNQSAKHKDYFSYRRTSSSSTDEFVDLKIQVSNRENLSNFNEVDSTCTAMHSQSVAKSGCEQVANKQKSTKLLSQQMKMISNIMDNGKKANAANTSCLSSAYSHLTYHPDNIHIRIDRTTDDDLPEVKVIRPVWKNAEEKLAARREYELCVRRANSARN